MELIYGIEYIILFIYRLEGPDRKIFCRGLSFVEAKFVLQNKDGEICVITWQTFFVICEAIIELVVDKIISSPEIILKVQWLTYCKKCYL